MGIFPNRKAVIRLIGAVLAEQHDEWTEQHRCLSLEALAKAHAVIATNPEPEEVANTSVLDAISA